MIPGAGVDDAIGKLLLDKVTPLALEVALGVDPDNRLVADTLEADWNDTLRALQAAQDEYERQTAAANAQLTEERKQITSSGFFTSPPPSRVAMPRREPGYRAIRTEPVGKFVAATGEN